jgi:hypothetical protein
MSIFTVLDTETGQIMLSMLLGLGLAALFQQTCNNANCTVYQAPSDNKITGRIFMQNGYCYKYNKETVKCNR